MNLDRGIRMLELLRRSCQLIRRKAEENHDFMTFLCPVLIVSNPNSECWWELNVELQRPFYINWWENRWTYELQPSRTCLEALDGNDRCDFCRTRLLDRRLVEFFDTDLRMSDNPTSEAYQTWVSYKPHSDWVEVGPSTNRYLLLRWLGWVELLFPDWETQLVERQLMLL